MNGNEAPCPTKYVFDTCAATFLIKRDKRMLDMEETLNTGDWYASVITRIELYAEPDMSADKRAGVDSFIESTSVIPMDDAIEQVTIAIRRDWRPKVLLPDCIVAATAVALGATLLTGDDTLKKLVWPGYTVHSL
ncbi:hypothetical protein AGMMS4952_13480 [Spirochaetia bacterium]|nr:hypothetical protein AGMMS4952_13480 [Spirochaetia bacterium]